jgi:hypothetical protein
MHHCKMEFSVGAAVAFALVGTAVIAFQIALALGAPWGAYAMGGAFPGRFPARLRLAAVVQAALLAAGVGIVLARAGLALVELAEAASWLIWIVVAVSAVAAVLNAISPSAGERRIWVPVTLLMLASGLVVALTAA